MVKLGPVGTPYELCADDGKALKVAQHLWAVASETQLQWPKEGEAGVFLEGIRGFAEKCRSFDDEVAVLAARHGLVPIIFFTTAAPPPPSRPRPLAEVPGRGLCLMSSRPPADTAVGRCSRPRFLVSRPRPGADHFFTFRPRPMADLNVYARSVLLEASVVFRAAFFC